jgi:hypothetical protein
MATTASTVSLPIRAKKTLSGASQVSVVESPQLRNRCDVALIRLLNRSVVRSVLGQR